jgi:uncharacterized small protein (DUF1192 family)
MNGHDPIVLQAIKNANQLYSIDGWWLLPLQQRGKAIYDEIKRLDAEAAIRKPSKKARSRP